MKIFQFQDLNFQLPLMVFIKLGRNMVFKFLVLDMQGRLLLKQEACELLDVTALAVGQYQLLVTNQDGLEIYQLLKQ
mgnify:CR=1 FL=1